MIVNTLFQIDVTAFAPDVNRRIKEILTNACVDADRCVRSNGQVPWIQGIYADFDTIRWVVDEIQRAIVDLGE